ncbi:hypothetical protein CC117_32555 [Parafrankia colletiae]|uniref:Uncharacterized protein n=1 Tax=Parafrankia colletiae TaxID=573497 RepID=A0A1S1RCL3_9ACTN|nr:hypothetical protein [Parafrankia colletiae]MCK9904363.1 hypothetical protein [Frankia sp. Cpl3]OHV43746.1 hypothetical protein CC117_32555 [Parafrankia colletiae]
MSGIVEPLIASLGTLVGVAAGGILAGRGQTVTWQREEASRERDTRQSIYARFISSAREWRAVVQSDQVVVREGGNVARGRHADGGPAQVETLKLQIEIRLVARHRETVDRAADVVDAIRQVAKARPGHEPGQVPDILIATCRQAERDFLDSARAELGIPPIDGGSGQPS